MGWGGVGGAAAVEALGDNTGNGTGVGGLGVSTCHCSELE